MEVFLVEDSHMVRERLEPLLAQVPGTTIVGHAAGATDAIREILSTRPALVVLDGQLAEGSGFDVLRALPAQAPEPGFVSPPTPPADPYPQTAERFGAGRC